MILTLIIFMVVCCGVILHILPEKDRSKTMASLLPIYVVENDCIVSKQGDITISFSVSLPEIFSLSSEEYETLHHTWLRALRILSPGTIVHKQDWFIENKYTANLNKESQSLIDRSSELFYNERLTLGHDCYLFVTFRANGRRLSSSVVSNLFYPSFISKDSINPQKVQEFLDKVGQFQRLLCEGGYISITRLVNEDLTGSKDKAGLIERYCFLLGKNDSPTLKDNIFKPEWKIGADFVQMFTFSDVDNLPNICGPRLTYDKYSTDKSKFPIGFASPVGQLLSFDHIYNQFLIIEDTPSVLKRIEAKRRRLQSLSTYSRENCIGMEAANEFLNETIGQQRLPVMAHFNLIVWTSDREKVKDIRNITSAAIAQMNAIPHLEVYGAPQLYWSSLPGNEAQIPFNECFETFCEQASCFITQETCYSDSVSPFGIRLVDRQQGKPLWVDISDLPMLKGWTTNRSKIVVGSSGSGKSLFMAHFIRSYYEQGAHCVIIDIGGSYSGLCKLLGGYYFTYTEKNPIKFNPFFIVENDVMDVEKKESLKTLIISLWKKDDEVYKRSEYVAISNAIHLYYEYLARNREVFPCFNSFYDFLRDVYIDILKGENLKDSDFDVNNFLYVLRQFYKDGEFGYLLNSTENLDLFNQRLLVFELDNVKDNPVLLPVLTLIICEQFISKMRKLKGIRKVIVIEEAWKAISKAGMAEFIKYLYKTVRKFFGEAIVVTQELDDVISSSIVKQAIINNSDCKILLDMRKFQNKFDQIQDAMSMSDKGKAMVLSLNLSNDPKRKYRELYIELGGTVMKVYGYEPSLFEYYAYTTEEREKVLVQKYTDICGGDIQKGIQLLIASQQKDV